MRTKITVQKAKSWLRRDLADKNTEEMSTIYLSEYYTLPSPEFHKTILDKTLGNGEAPPHSI